MAYMIPETLPRGAKVTAGERLLFATLKEHLPDDYIVYYEPRIFGRCPDFVVIGPDLGMLVLEVKDYTESTLYELFPEQWRIYNKQGELSTVVNPLHQARNYAFRIASKLKKDKSLVQLDGAYRGNLKFRFGFGVVLTQMREMHIVKHQLHRVIEPQFMLTRDDIDTDRDDFDGTALLERMLDMFTVPFHQNQMLGEDDIKAIRYHLFPEVRISAEYKPPVHHDDQLLLSLHNLQAMDLHQESLARQLGDKNRLIRGVAGSGKTLILSARARLLSKEHPDRKILVLCYGIPLSRVLKSMIHKMMEEPEDLFDFAEMSAEESGNPAAKKHNVETATFHEWLKNTLRIPDAGIEPLLEKVKLGEAILIRRRSGFRTKLVGATEQSVEPGNAIAAAGRRQSAEHFQTQKQPLVQYRTRLPRTFQDPEHQLPQHGSDCQFRLGLLPHALRSERPRQRRQQRRRRRDHPASKHQA